MIQTKEEILQISEQWQLNDAPDDLILRGDKGERNGTILAKAIFDRFNGVFSRENLTKAYQAVRSQLEHRQPQVKVVEKIVEKPAVIQTPEQSAQIRGEWWNKYAPQDLPRTDSNDAALASYVQSYFGVTNITALNEAANHAPGLRRLSAAEIQAAVAKKEGERMRRDYQNSIKDRSVIENQKNNAEKTAKAKQEAEAKELQSLKDEIAKEINGYFVGHPSGGRNYGRSEEGQNKLRAVASNYNQLTSVDAAKRVLENVKTAKHKLP